MRPFLDRFDRGMQRLSRWSLGEVSQREPIPAREDELARKAIRSLYVTAMFGDLPEAGQVHPGMQARVRRALPEIDDAVMGMCDYLESCSPEQAGDLRRWHGRLDNPVMTVAERLDDLLADAGMSGKQRLRIRAATAEVASQLRNRPLQQVLEEYVGQTRRLASRAGSVEEVERLMMAQMGERAFWEQQERLAALAAQWEQEGAEGEAPPLESNVSPAGAVDAGVNDTGGLPPDVTAPSAPSQWPSQPAAPGTGTIALTPEQLEAVLAGAEQEGRVEAEQERLERLRTRGAYVLGIGAVATSLGIACYVIPLAGFFLTPFVGGSGLIVLLVGLGMVGKGQEG